MTRSIGVATATLRVLLLLSDGLFNFAWGSFSSCHGEEVSPDIVFEGFDGKVGQIHTKVLESKYPLTASVHTTTITTEPPVGYATRLDLRGENLKFFSKQSPAIAINSRDLQESDCGDGAASIGVSSKVFPLLEGCFVANVIDGARVYSTDTAIMFSVESTSTEEPPKWHAYYKSSTDVFTLACVSDESSDDVIAAEATWYCDNDGDGLAFTLADGEFSVSCGCSVASPSPIASPAPVTISNSVPTCGEGGSFSIASDTLPDTEGCYLDTAEINYDSPVYTTSGTMDLGQMWIVAVEYTDKEETVTVIWALVYVLSSTSNDDNTFYCFSEVEAALYHPADVPVWQCDIDGDGFTDATTGVLSFLCDCPSSTPQPGPTPAVLGSSPTLAPFSSSLTTAPLGSSSSSTGVCADGDSFSIASETLPDIDGCYLDTTGTNNDRPVYTASGTMDLGQIWMVAVEAKLDETSSVVLWMLVYVESTSSNDDNDFYCISEAEAALYHPADVPVWQCDTDGDGSFETTTPNIVSVSCGCSNTLALSTTPAPVLGTNTTTCLAGASFSIKSDTLPDAEGCYVDTTELTHELAVYTVSGTSDVGQFWVVAIEFIEDGTSATVWALQNVVSSPPSFDNEICCVSLVEAALYHPSEVPEWQCDGEGTSVTAARTIVVECGCSSSSSPLAPTTPFPPPPTPPTVAQTLSPTSTVAPSSATGDEPQLVASTCTGDGSFTITASAAPVLNGCFVDTGFEGAGGRVFYSVSGTMDTATEILVTPVESDSGDDFNWLIGSTEGDKDGRVYCYSAESASEVNPGNASWMCDFLSDGEYLTATEGVISIVCGACAVSTEDASPASKLSVRVVTAGSAGVAAAVASSIGGWC